MSSIREAPKTTVKKTTPGSEMKMPAPDATSLYTPEEAEIVARMKGFINHDMYIFARVHTLEDSRDDREIPDATLKRRKEIIDEIGALVDKILRDRDKETKEFTLHDFDVFVDEHIDTPEYRFLGTRPDTLNKNAWGFFGGLVRPLELGVKIGPNEAATRQSNWRSGH